MTQVKDKLSKTRVNYRQAGGKTRQCRNCAMWHPAGTCDLVAGLISATAVCDRWTKKGK